MRSKIVDLFYKPLRGCNSLLNRLLSVRIMRDKNLYDWQMNPYESSTPKDKTLPPGAAIYLRRENPRLRDLKQRYRAFNTRATSSKVWMKNTISDNDILYFRGHNSFTDQLSGLHANELTYALTYYSLKASPAADLLALFNDDGAFGAWTFQIDGRTVTRDALDSSREIEFIRSYIGWEKQPLTMIDVGAGYGRLVQRLAEAGGDQIIAAATDGFAPSTFIAEYCLRYRGLENTSAVPLDEVEDWLAAHRPRLATNVHSFSEIEPEAIDWWVERLSRHRVDYLMIIPNRTDLDSGAALTNAGISIDEIVDRHGYRLQVRETHHGDPAVQKYAVDRSTISLFRLEGAR